MDATNGWSRLHKMTRRFGPVKKSKLFSRVCKTDEVESSQFLRNQDLKTQLNEEVDQIFKTILVN